jgi:hypothetical protein
MKTIRKNLYKYLGVAITVFLFASCVDYLDKAPEITLTENDVFTKFTSYQGFVEDIYQNVVDQTIGTDAEMNWNFGDDVVCTYSDMIEPHFARGDYWKWTHWKQSPFQGFYGGNNDTKRKGYYQNGWYGIRSSNLALKNLDRLVGTQEEKDIIQGQCLFFRGYFHWEILRSWGGLPYIDTVYDPTAVLNKPRLSYLETANRINDDLTKAAALLPARWDDTEVGKATLGSNAGRITKGAAFGYMGMNWLYAASPLANGTETGNFIYNVDLCKKAAAAFNEVIKLADQGYYKLETWANYRNVFYTLTGVMPNSNPEVVFSNPIYMYKRWNYGEQTLPAMGGWGTYAAVTANYVDLFGMANGLPIDATGSGYDPAHPWDNRDPRFYYNILKDGDLLVQNVNNADKYAQFFVPNGRHRQARDGFISFGHHKFFHVTCNQFDNGWGSGFYYEVPHLRLAEVYLNFAEAANEAYGPTGAVPGSNLTAVQAVNIVRARAGVPAVDARFTGSTDAFRDIVRQERAVELAFEGHRWHDLRRWHIAHLTQYKEKYNLEFDQAHTYFKKVLVKTAVFDMKHYWLPFPVNQEPCTRDSNKIPDGNCL